MSRGRDYTSFSYYLTKLQTQSSITHRNTFCSSSSAYLYYSLQPVTMNEPNQLQFELWKYIDSEHQLSSQPRPEQRSLETLHRSLLTVFQQRDKDIQSLEQDLTKCRCELSKANKQLKELQEKCSIGASNANNTGSNFMLPAEFKAKFDSFMKQTVSGALAGLTHRPKSYVFLLQQTLQLQYRQLEAQLQHTLEQIATVLRLQSTPNLHKALFTQLLKPMQDNHALLFKLDALSTAKQLEQVCGLDEQLLEIIQSSEFAELLEELNQLVAYMLLQEARWQFILPQKKLVDYNKKDHTCVDGWIKQQDKVVLLIEGMKRPAANGGFTVHQQLKNFVIPYTDDSELTPKAKQRAASKQQMPSQPAPVQPEVPIKRSLSLVSTIVGIQLQPKVHQQPQESINDKKVDREPPMHNNFVTVPLVPIPTAVRMKQLLESLPLKKSTAQQQAKKKKPAASKISGLLTDPSFSEELLTTKRQQKKEESSTRLLDAEFESRIVNRQLRTNTAFERNKNGVLKKEKSIGKIIHQLSKLSLKDEPYVNNAPTHGHSHTRCASNKQNHNINNKQAIYKSIICSQLRQERAVIKLREPRKQDSIFGDLLASKTDRQEKQNSRKRQQNRPLKPNAQHMQRVREKHHLLY